MRGWASGGSWRTARESRPHRHWYRTRPGRHRVAGVGPVSRADWLAINARGQRFVVVLAERGDACAERGARAHGALHERTGATDAAWRAAAVITSSISPRAGRSPHAVALWGVLTGEAPDEVPIDISEQRGRVDRRPRQRERSRRGARTPGHVVR